VSTPGPTGAATYIASATIAYGDRRLTPRLSTDELGVPVDYKIEVRNGTDLEEYRSTISRGRISMRSRSPRGESAREYVVADGSVILDEDVFHQYFFLGRKRPQGTVPVIVPRRNVQTTARVTSRGADPVSIAGRPV